MNLEFIWTNLRSTEWRQSMLQLTKTNFEPETQREAIVLIDCQAGWCKACKDFAPTFSAAAGRHPDVMFATVDTEAETELTSRLGITHIPALLLLRDGLLLFRQPGYVDGPGLDNILQQARHLDMHVVRAHIESEQAVTQRPNPSQPEQQPAAASAANQKEDEMDKSEVSEFKKELSVRWIKAESGATYLCPVDALKRLNNPNEEQLKVICVDESLNPQND